MRQGDAYLHQQTGPCLVQIMACCLFDTNWALVNKFHGNLNKNTKIFAYEKVFENVVCKMSAIVSGQNGCVNPAAFVALVSRAPGQQMLHFVYTTE